MTYTVLARKYRPQTFSDVVGQDHVARTLSNALSAGRVAHAFLFTGARGVGKTTSARLLAKALNCEKGPSANPCNVCSPCTEITQGVDIDVLEIDGASNNSVEDVRRLQESIPFRPARDRTKIIIVDEVHMLSTGAFNAFLKTLEEPPPHVKFIFATTESHKVPITIRSRCQRYDFRLISQAVIAQHVRRILEAESIAAEDQVVAIVAREAAGSMRDALTLLDQLLAFGGKELRAKGVTELLGIADRGLLQQALGSALGGDPAAAVEAVSLLTEHGLDPLHFARALLGLVRDAIVLRVSGPDSGLVDLVEEERTAVVQLCVDTSTPELERLFSGLSLLVDDVARSAEPRLVLEMGLVRLSTRPKLEDFGTLLTRLEQLERPSEGSRAVSQRSPTRASDARPPAQASRREAAPAVARSSSPAPVPEPVTPIVQTVENEPGGTADLVTWERIVHALRDTRPALAAILEHGMPAQVSPSSITIAFPEGSFFGTQAASEEARADIAEVASTIVGAKPTVEVIFSKDAPPPGATVAQREATRREARAAEKKREALSHPRVIEAMQIFPHAAANVEVDVDLD